MKDCFDEGRVVRSGTNRLAMDMGLLLSGRRDLLVRLWLNMNDVCVGQ